MDSPCEGHSVDPPDNACSALAPEVTAREACCRPQCRADYAQFTKMLDACNFRAHISWNVITDSVNILE